MMNSLQNIVSEFAREIIGDDESESYCYMVCWPLVGYLKFLGYKVGLIEGKVGTKDGEYLHYWIKYNGNIIDPTADQFNDLTGDNMPMVYIGEKPQHYIET